MFIITDPVTMGWLEKMYGFYKEDPARHDKNFDSFTNYIKLQRVGTIAFNDAMGAIGILVYNAYLESRKNPINLDDNCDPNPPNQVGSDPGPGLQP